MKHPYLLLFAITLVLAILEASTLGRALVPLSLAFWIGLQLLIPAWCLKSYGTTPAYSVLVLSTAILTCAVQPVR